MYKLLIGLMLVSALHQLGLSLKDFAMCRSRGCAARIERASRRVLQVDWKAISVFPEEAKRLHDVPSRK